MNLPDKDAAHALRLHGAVDEAVAAALGSYTAHLSLSHDGGSAVALVVIDR